MSPKDYRVRLRLSGIQAILSFRHLQVERSTPDAPHLPIVLKNFSYRLKGHRQLYLLCLPFPPHHKPSTIPTHHPQLIRIHQKLLLYYHRLRIILLAIRTTLARSGSPDHPSKIGLSGQRAWLGLLLRQLPFHRGPGWLPTTIHEFQDRRSQTQLLPTRRTTQRNAIKGSEGSLENDILGTGKRIARVVQAQRGKVRRHRREFQDVGTLREHHRKQCYQKHWPRQNMPFYLIMHRILKALWSHMEMPVPCCSK